MSPLLLATDAPLVSQNLPKLEDLYAEYHDVIYRRLYHLTGCHEDAEDLTQDTFVRAARALPRLRSTAHIKSWLYTIATNLVRDVRRHRAILSMQPLDNLSLLPALASDPQEVCEARLCIERALARMTPVHQRIWYARYIQNDSQQALASLLGGTRSSHTIHNMISKANRAFRSAYRQEVQE